MKLCIWYELFCRARAIFTLPKKISVFRYYIYNTVIVTLSFQKKNVTIRGKSGFTVFRHISFLNSTKMAKRNNQGTTVLKLGHLWLFLALLLSFLWETQIVVFTFFFNQMATQRLRFSGKRKNPLQCLPPNAIFFREMFENCQLKTLLNQKILQIITFFVQNIIVTIWWSGTILFWATEGHLLFWEMAMETQWENAKFYANFLVGKNLIWSVILRIEPESGFNKMAKNN